VVGITVGVWVTRYLGPDRFGLLSYAMAFVGLFAAISTLGLDGIVVRELVKTPERRDVLLGTSFILKLIGAFVSLMLLGTAIFLNITTKNTAIIMMLIGSATVFQAFNVIDIYFQSKVLSKYVVFAQAISMVVVNGVKVALILNKASLVWFAGVVGVEALLISVGLVGYYLKSGVKLKEWTVDRGVASELLRDSWPLIIGSISATIYMKIDIIIIQLLLGERDTGYYTAAARLSELFLFITMIITKSIAPKITEAKQRNYQEYLNLIQSVYNILVKIAVTLSIGLYVIAPQLIILLFGSEFTHTIPIFQIYIWSTVMVYLSNASWLFYLNEGLEVLASLRLIIGAIVNLILNIILIQMMGVVGAAYATLLSYSFSSYIFNILSPKTIVNFKLQTTALLNIFNIRTWITPFK